MIFKNGSTIISLLGLVCLIGCAGAGIPDAKPTTGRNPTIAEVPEAKESVRGEDDPPIVTLDLGSMLHERHLSAGDDLPGKIIIPTTNLDAVPITAALQAVLAGTDVSLAWDTNTLGNRLVTVMNLSGPLPQVVEKICAAAKVFCVYRHGSLELADRETFVVSLPPLAKGIGGSGASNSASANSMVDAINQIVGSKSQIDEQGGNIIYTTDVSGQERVHQYLEQLRNGRALVVLQLYIWEVTLNKENGEGINWTEFNPGVFGPGFAKLALSSTVNTAATAVTAASAGSSFTSLSGETGSFGIGAVTTGHLKTSSLISFLSTQGRLQTISSPQVTFVSGSSAELKVGGTQRYISQVGTNTANVSGTTATNTSTNTISTDSIDTGLSIEIQGLYENGVVFANLNLALKNLVGLNPTTSAGQTIDLPNTTDQKINTSVRVRPGDNLIMAGLVTSSDTNSRQGIPFFNDTQVPMYGDDQLQNHELVIMLKPSIILFSDKSAVTEAQHRASMQAVDAVYIDKDGTKSVVVPGSLTTPAVTDNGSAVDRQMMQSGFSRAFDELLHTPTTSVSSNGSSSP